ncbi:MAG: helix-turn-helix domain-containing protein [Cyanobacteria bacterium LVE1205-1]
MSYTQLSTAERNRLYELKTTTSLSLRAMGRQLGRDVSTISRELGRNRSEEAYYYLTVPNRGCRSGNSNPRRRLVRYERTVFSRCEAAPQPRANCWWTQARESNPDQS